MEGNTYHEKILDMVANDSDPYSFEQVISVFQDMGEEAVKAEVIEMMQSLCETREWRMLVSNALASAVAFGDRRFSAGVGMLGSGAGDLQFYVLITELGAEVLVDGLAVHQPESAGDGA